MVEQVAIQNLLASIPSQASNFAITCVEKLLEDQIQNPFRMAKNLKRIGSAMSDWGLTLSGEMNEAGDTGMYFFPKEHKRLNPPLLNLPLKIRSQIWSHLDNKDLINLRLVCSKTQFDVDVSVGLPVVMDTGSDSMKWISRVTTKSCFVTHLDNFLYFNFFPQPERLESLRFHRKIFVPAEMLDIVLRKFPFLRTVIFYTQELYQIADGKTMTQICPSVNTEMCSTLDQCGSLFGLGLIYKEEGSVTEWNLELKPAEFPRVIKQAQLGQVYAEIPQSRRSQQRDCIRFLERQHQLFDLRSDLEGTKWEEYTKIISQSAKTLTGLHLLHLANNGAPFECQILKDCTNLRFLTISGKCSANLIEDFSYLPLVGIQWLASDKLRTVTLEQVYIPEEDFCFVNQHLKKTVWVWMRKCLCGNEKYIDLKLGNNCYLKNTNGHQLTLGGRDTIEWEESSSDSEEDDFESDFDEQMDHFYYGHDALARRACAGSTLVTRFVKVFPMKAVKGIVVTAWIALC